MIVEAGGIEPRSVECYSSVAPADGGRIVSRQFEHPLTGFPLPCGGLLPPVTGLMPCPLAAENNQQNKITQNRGLAPHGVLYTGVYVRQKKKKAISKAGGWRYPSIKGHARPMFNLLYH
jgi:hypothetical protein